MGPTQIQHKTGLRLGEADRNTEKCPAREQSWEMPPPSIILLATPTQTNGWLTPFSKVHTKSSLRVSALNFRVSSECPHYPCPRGGSRHFPFPQEGRSSPCQAHTAPVYCASFLDGHSMKIPLLLTYENLLQSLGSSECWWERGSKAGRSPCFL